MDGLPQLTPSCVTAGKEHSVVIEFPRDLPALLVTLDFYYESTGKKLGSVPVVILGPKTVRAKFPEFPKPGEVEVVVKIRHEESSLFPKFKLHVQSPIEAIYHNVPISKASSRSAVLATVLAYLLHSDESQKDREIRSHIDIILCNILQSLSDVPHWDLTSILSGKHGHDENLLHFCMRHKLDGMATLLLQPKNIEGRVYYLQQRGYDNKTPIEIARKNDMKRITEIAQGILSEYESQPSGKHSRPSTPDQKKWRKGRVKRAKSVDTQLSDLGPLPLYLEKKKGGKLAEKLKFKIMGRKSKDVHEISLPQPPALTELDTTEVLQEGRYSYLLKEEPGDTRPASVLERADEPGMGIGPGPEPASPVPIEEQWGASKPHRNVPFPLPRIAASHTTSGFESGSLPATLDRPSPIARFSDEDALTGSHDPTALPSPPAIESPPAVSELKKKSLYTAVVTKHYCWASPPYGDIILREGDRVYVTKEEEGMCLGICNNCFGKFPKDILKPLSTDEEATPGSKDETAYTGSDSDSVTYDEVDPDPDDGYYKVPRNIVRISESDSDSDHLYDHVPVKDQLEMLKHLPEGHYLIVRRPSDTPLAPGRLLPGYADASSHETGLDRLGIQYTERRHTANKAATLGARSTLRGSYENVVLDRSPSEPVGINKLMGSEGHFTANPHNNQGEMESTKSCEHIVQEENMTPNEPESENTDFKQESITPATVSETKQANANTITVSNDGKVDEEARNDLAVVKEEVCDVKSSPFPVPDGSTVAAKEEQSSSTDHQMVDTSSQETTNVDEEAHAVVKEEICDVKSSPLPVPGGSTVAAKEEQSSSTDHQMVDTASQEPTEVDEEAHDDLAVVKEELCDVKPSPLPVPDGSTVAPKEEHTSSTDHQMVDTASQETTNVDEEAHAVVKEELCDVKPSPLSVPGDSTVAAKEERTDPQMVDTASQEPTRAENTEGTVRDVIARSNPTPTKRTLLPPKQHSPVPKPRPKKRPLSTLTSQKQEVASHSIPTEDGAPNTKPMEERLKMQARATRDSPPSPKPSQSRQLSSPIPVDKREIEAPGPRAQRKTGPPPIPPKPYASQKGGKEGVKPGNASSE